LTKQNNQVSLKFVFKIFIEINLEIQSKINHDISPRRW